MDIYKPRPGTTSLRLPTEGLPERGGLAQYVDREVTLVGTVDASHRLDQSTTWQTVLIRLVFRNGQPASDHMLVLTREDPKVERGERLLVRGFISRYWRKGINAYDYCFKPHVSFFRSKKALPAWPE